MCKVIIVIPIYKSQLTAEEMLSFRQCCKVLGTHPISVITYADLDCSEYYKIAAEYHVNILRENFDKNYFASVSGYNKLCLSVDFYSRFGQYEYMLIYQLDAYVFKDELVYWCSNGYDFIGAPLIEDVRGCKDIIYEVFNGGFSLRKINYCIKLLQCKNPLLTPSKLWRIRCRQKKKTTRDVIVWIFMCLGYHNSVDYVINRTFINEDLFFCLIFDKDWGGELTYEPQETWLKAKFPSATDAMRFAFERYPSYLHKLNNKQLPFGCHGWKKYESNFWKEYILE